MGEEPVTEMRLRLQVIESDPKDKRFVAGVRMTVEHQLVDVLEAAERELHWAEQQHLGEKEARRRDAERICERATSMRDGSASCKPARRRLPETANLPSSCTRSLSAPTLWPGSSSSGGGACSGPPTRAEPSRRWAAVDPRTAGPVGPGQGRR